MLLQAKKSKETAQKYSVPYEFNELQYYVHLQVLPVDHSPETYFLVVFQQASSTGIQPLLFELDRSSEDTAFDQSTVRIEQLERELTQTRANMRDY